MRPDFLNLSPGRFGQVFENFPQGITRLTQPIRVLAIAEGAQCAQIPIGQRIVFELIRTQNFP